MGFNCGIVGLPNVGKSTLFNALTKSGIAAENFPFCTIEPNSGVVPMPDTRLDALAAIVKPERVIPTTMEFVDIAGLVAGASKGEGLGNKFLANIRETDAIAHVVRCFEDENVIHVSNSVDPKRDIEIIDLELIFADLDSCEKQLQKVARNAKGGDKDALAQKAVLERLIPHFTEGKPARSLMKGMSVDEKQLIRGFHLLTSKPVMYIANVAEDGFENNPHLDVVKAIAEEEGAIVVPVCNKIEAEIAELDDGEEKDMFLESLGLEEPGLNRVIRAGYSLLNLQTYFTAGVKEVRAWTVRIGATAPQAAVVSLMAKEKTAPKLRFQLLLWPVTDASFDTDSYKQYAEGHFLTRNMMTWFWDNYTTNPAERAQIYASPLRADTEQLKGLPPALVQTAGLDVLRDEAEAYARKLDAAGVPVTAVRYNGMIHDYGLLNPLAQVPEVQAAMRQAGAELRAHLN